MNSLSIRTLLILLTTLTIIGCGALLGILLYASGKADKAFRDIVTIEEPLAANLQHMTHYEPYKQHYTHDIKKPLTFHIHNFIKETLNKLVNKITSVFL